MKKSFLLLSTLFFLSVINAQNIGIGTSTPSPSAMLEIKSTSQGFLPPRLTIVQRDSIVSPVAGLQIWNSDCKELQVYNGTEWTNMIGGQACVGYVPNVAICSQFWMTKNLNVTTYRNGDIIPEVTNPALWAGLSTGAWCWYNNDSATYAATYGKLYNWFAVHDPRGLAPTGWHIPTKAEWLLVEPCLLGYDVAGGKMKETGTTHWVSPNEGATNSTGFTALPGGFRYTDGAYYNLGGQANFWSSDENASSTNNAWYDYLSNSTTLLYNYAADKNYGFSVRCIKD